MIISVSRSLILCLRFNKMHEKHRERLRKKFIANSDLLENHEILELLLTFSIPRKNTNAIAHNLLKRFGSISNVLNANETELKNVDGIGENSALFLNLLKTVFRIYIESECKGHKKIKKLTMSEINTMLFTKFIGRDEENVAIALFNPKREITYCDLIEKGTVNFVNIDFRKIVNLALKHNATFIVLAHNHPSGIALPSREDINFTEKLSEILDSLGIKLLDHLIVCKDDYVSLCDNSVYENEKSDINDSEIMFYKKAI